MTTVTGSINQQTLQHSQAIHNAKMGAVGIIAALDSDTLQRVMPLITAFNDLAEHSEQLIRLEAAQRRYLEAFCRNMEAKAEARS